MHPVLLAERCEFHPHEIFQWDPFEAIAGFGQFEFRRRIDGIRHGVFPGPEDM